MKALSIVFFFCTLCIPLWGDGVKLTYLKDGVAHELTDVRNGLLVLKHPVSGDTIVEAYSDREDVAKRIEVDGELSINVEYALPLSSYSIRRTTVRSYQVADSSKAYTLEIEQAVPVEAMPWDMTNVDDLYEIVGWVVDGVVTKVWITRGTVKSRQHDRLWEVLYISEDEAIGYPLKWIISGGKLLSRSYKAPVEVASISGVDQEYISASYCPKWKP